MDQPELTSGPALPLAPGARDGVTARALPPGKTEPARPSAPATPAPLRNVRRPVAGQLDSPAPSVRPVPRSMRASRLKLQVGVLLRAAQPVRAYLEKSESKEDMNISPSISGLAGLSTKITFAPTHHSHPDRAVPECRASVHSCLSGLRRNIRSHRAPAGNNWPVTVFLKSLSSIILKGSSSYRPWRL